MNSRIDPDLDGGVQPAILAKRLVHCLCCIQEQWMDYRAAHCPDESVGSIVNDESPSNSHVTDEVELFERLMGHVKEVMSVTSP